MKYALYLVLIFSIFKSVEAQQFTAVIQKGHGEVVKAAKYTVDGKYLITVSRDKSAKVWEAQTGQEIRSFLGHQHTVNDFSVNGSTLATSSADGTAAIWDIPSGKMVWQSNKYDHYVTSVDINQKGTILVIGSSTDSLDIIDLKNFKTLKRIPTNADKGLGYGIDVRFSPDGKYLAVGEDQRTAKVYNTKNWSLEHELKPSQGYCGGCGTLVSFSPDSRYLAKLSNGDAFVKYESATGEEVFRFGEDFEDIVATNYHPSGDYFSVATEDSIFIFSEQDNQLISALRYPEEINDVSFHPTENHITIALGKVVIIADFQGNELQRFEGILNQSSTGLDYDLGSYWEHYIAKWVKYKSARFLNSGELYVGKTGNKARKWNVKNASIAMEFNGHEKGILCFEKIDTNTIATGSGDGKIIIWDSETGKQKQIINAHREPIFDLALSNNGKLLASSSWDGVIAIWDTETWKRYKYKYNEGASAYDIEFTQNDAYLVTGLLNKTLKLLEVETQSFVKEYIGHTDNVTSIEVAGSEVLTSSWDGSIILWDLYSGLIKQRLFTGASVFEATRNNGQIISVGADRLISIWDTKTGDKQMELPGHQAEINGLEIENNLMVTSDVDGTTKFWDLTNQKELFEHIQIGRNDWMVKTPEGYFDATDNAISNIHFVRGMEAVNAEQVMDRFFIPGLVEDIFSPKKKSKQTMGNLLNTSLPPILKLSGLIEQDIAKLYIKAEDLGGGIEDLKLYHNGKRVQLAEETIKIRTSENIRYYSFEYPMVAGHNEFMAVASSKSDIESNQTSVRLFSDSKVPGSTCHILAVGINEYLNQSLNLNYAKDDAASFASEMQKSGSSIYANVKLHQIYDRDASKQNILDRIETLKSEISINDVFVFYYAGHGSIVNDNFYLISSDAKRLYDKDKVEEFGINAETLQRALQEIKALKQLIVLDACQSGGAGEILLQRGAPQEKAIAQLSRSSGIHVMASAGSEQYATEFESLGHGLFTYALLKGLSGEADGAPKDGKVTIYELKSYLDDQVPELSIQYKGSPQYPHTFSRGQDFPVVIVDN